MVAGLLRRQRAGQPRHLDPHGVVQVLFTGVDRAGDDDRHPEQTGPVLLRGQEVQLCTHLKQETEKLRSIKGIYHKHHYRTSSHHLPVHSDDVSDKRAVLDGSDVSVGHSVRQGHLWTGGH